MTDATGGEAGIDRDVVIVGGGPAGCSAGVFTARAGLDTVIFDRGRSSIQRCAHLENYLGFPAGIDVETLYGLMRDHAERAGCEIVPDLVESVERANDGLRTTSAELTGTSSVGDGEGFVIRRESGGSVTARRVIAATRYDAGDYLRGLDDEDAMFETFEHDGETTEHFDKGYADENGSTPVDGLFVASPHAGTSPQAITAAGHGARVGVRVVEAARRDRGYPGQMADYYDWRRRERDRTGEWQDRDRWREFYEGRFPDDHDLSDERVAEIREREVDRRLDQYITEEEAEERAEEGQRRLLEHVDDDLVLEAAREIEAERETADD